MTIKAGDLVRVLTNIYTNIRINDVIEVSYIFDDDISLPYPIILRDVDGESLPYALNEVELVSKLVSGVGHV